jgi:Rrf2 family nitric oxide-sensitive transcriptional repressor
MQLNKQTDYALRVLVYLASINNQQLVQIDDIAERFKIARNHLTKIVSKLAKLGYIITYRGIGGGMKLNLDALNLRLDQIVSKFEPSFEVIDCEHLACPMIGMCNLKHILDSASSQFVAKLAQYKLCDLIPSAKERPKKEAVASPQVLFPLKLLKE